MGDWYMKKCLLATMIVVVSLNEIEAGRTLEGEKWYWWHKNLVLLHSLQRGPIGGSQRNPCSTVPGRSRGRCTLAQININVVNHALPSSSSSPPLPPPQPQLFPPPSIHAPPKHLPLH
ncbi:hypothetical protein VNO78_18497 [Psophocarpus tetragonolobus]|uniref:Uncharacterized protein n=1 Tax=Psophocarpus tetragonolobus TaxID=3891 RepID=A0AAN9SIJ5_PSOTE